MEPNSTKTIYRYDSRGSGFKKAAYLLLTLALLLAIKLIFFPPKVQLIENKIFQEE